MHIFIFSGKTGQPLELITNYFPLTSYTNWSLYQYQVDFSLEVEMIGVQRGLISSHREFLGPHLFDGKYLYSSRKYISNVSDIFIYFYFIIHTYNIII